jgi:1,2-dihydroxy-3-keto-5-methylthiopentene dioxygenase
MATIRLPDDGRTVEGDEAVRAFLDGQGIDFERWSLRPLNADATAADVLFAYAEDVERLKASGGYVTADVIDVHAETPGLEAMLARFKREHWHDEDEVRFVLDGRGVFYIHPRDKAVFAIEVGPGDLIRVPRGTWHWFDLCFERRIRAIRLFQDPSGWTPVYTDSGAERGREPLCMSPQGLAGA